MAICQTLVTGSKIRKGGNSVDTETRCDAVVKSLDNLRRCQGIRPTRYQWHDDGVLRFFGLISCKLPVHCVFAAASCSTFSPRCLCADAADPREQANLGESFTISIEVAKHTVNGNRMTAGRRALGNLKAVPLVETHILVLMRIEPARDTFGVCPREHGAHQAATEAAPLMSQVDTDRREIPMRLDAY